MANRRLPPKTPGAFLESFGTLRYIPRFFRLIWATSPPLTGLNIVARLLQSVTPVLLLYVGKLIIDSVVAHIANSSFDLRRRVLLSREEVPPPGTGEGR